MPPPHQQCCAHHDVNKAWVGSARHQHHVTECSRQPFHEAQEPGLQCVVARLEAVHLPQCLWCNTSSYRGQPDSTGSLPQMGTQAGAMLATQQRQSGLDTEQGCNLCLCRLARRGSLTFLGEASLPVAKYTVLGQGQWACRQAVDSDSKRQRMRQMPAGALSAGLLSSSPVGLASAQGSQGTGMSARAPARLTWRFGGFCRPRAGAQSLRRCALRPWLALASLHATEPAAG